jgi:rRNA-processing protein FCF1
MAVAQHPTAWFEDTRECLGGFEPVILDCVLSELKRIAEERRLRARYARIALTLAKGFLVVKGGGGAADDEITSYAGSADAVVATVDGEMIRRLAALGMKGITLKSGRVALV